MSGDRITLIDDNGIGVEVDTEFGDLVLDLDGERYQLTTTPALRAKLRKAIERSTEYADAARAAGRLQGIDMREGDTDD